MNLYIASVVRRGSAVLLAAVLGLGVTIPEAVGQEPPAEVLTRGYSAEVVERVRQIMDDSNTRGLPSGVLADRALEGAAKGVTGAALIEGLERELADLERASESLGPAASPASVEAGALALEHGLPAGDLAHVADAVPAGGIPVALLFVSELHRLGVPVDRALEAVARARARGGDAAALMTLGASLRAEDRMSRGAVLRALGSRGFAPPGVSPAPGPAAWSPTDPPVPPGTGVPPGPPGGDGERPGGGPPPGSGG